MRTSRWLAVAAVIGSLAAQEPQAPNEVDPAPAAPTDPAVLGDVCTRLRSEVLAHVAWGGFLAGEHGLRELAPDLRAALARVAPGNRSSNGYKSFESDLAARALLDGLIRIEAAVPAAELAPFLREPFPAAAFLLLARRASERDAAASLLSLFRDRDQRDWSDVVWLAAGNLLARNGSPEFVAAALEGLELQLHVTVTSPGVICGISVSGRGCGFPVRSPRLPRSFPPIAAYVLQQKATAWLIAPGQQPVWVERCVQRDRWDPPGLEVLAGQERRIEWLANLGGFDARVLRPKTDLEVTWQTPEAYLEEVTAARAEIERSFHRLIDQLVRRGYSGGLHAEAWDAPIAIEVDEQCAFELRLPALPREWEAWRERRPLVRVR